MNQIVIFRLNSLDDIFSGFQKDGFLITMSLREAKNYSDMSLAEAECDVLNSIDEINDYRAIRLTDV